MHGGTGDYCVPAYHSRARQPLGCVFSACLVQGLNKGNSKLKATHLLLRSKPSNGQVAFILELLKLLGRQAREAAGPSQHVCV